MNAEEKRKLVEKLVDLTVRAVRDPMRKHPALADELFKEINEKIRQQMRKQQIEIRLKHFNLEQLVALLDFYETDLGKSIIASQGLISDEIDSAMQLVTHEVLEETQDSRREVALRRLPDRHESKLKPNRIDNPGPGWVMLTGAQIQGDRENPGVIPDCSFCKEKPSNIGEMVAGPNLFICRNCVIDACEALKDSGYPVD